MFLRVKRLKNNCPSQLFRVFYRHEPTDVHHRKKAENESPVDISAALSLSLSLNDEND